MGSYDSRHGPLSHNAMIPSHAIHGQTQTADARFYDNPRPEVTTRNSANRDTSTGTSRDDTSSTQAKPERTQPPNSASDSHGPPVSELKEAAMDGISDMGSLSSRDAPPFAPERRQSPFGTHDDETDHDTEDGVDHPAARVQVPAMGTPSTISTAPSTDEASLSADAKFDDFTSVLPNLLQSTGSHGHRRIGSWDDDVMRLSGPAWRLQPQVSQAIAPRGTASHQRVASFRYDNRPVSPRRMVPLPPQYVAQAQNSQTHSHPFHQHQHQHQQLRNESHAASQAPPASASVAAATTWASHIQSSNDHHHHQQQQQQQHGLGTNRQFHPTNQSARSTTRPTHVDENRQAATGHYSHTPRRSPHGNTSGISRSRSLTPPRNSRGGRGAQHGQAGRHAGASNQPPGSPHHASSSGAHRSSSEILKTLLRKKACLYEPDTSRAVALVTWLVGRELAVEYGYFSRQQLQSGVHACVAGKIDSGIITRTKVNRCMQIILNSCFHYIIPRSDGTEENGDAFRATFTPQASDDSALLEQLPAPWDNLKVDRRIVLEACSSDADDRSVARVSTPKSSPRLTGMSDAKHERSPSRSHNHDNDSVSNDNSKRAVLLCFNENVRCAEDIFRCHNEFIRDTANASHLQLSGEEWRAFFGRHPSNDHFPWSTVGVPVVGGRSADHTVQITANRQPDALGQMTAHDVAKFRTTWCSKRYDHNHELCGFAHPEINGGWLRRDTDVHSYSAELCPHISFLNDKDNAGCTFVLNECPYGLMCSRAHSKEEVRYSPLCYKLNVCQSVSHLRSRGCRLGDVCPHLHPVNSGIRPMKRSHDSRHGSNRHARKGEQGTARTSVEEGKPPTAAPILYTSPAPASEFERSLGLPGLQGIYRRHCSVIRAYNQLPDDTQIIYSCFGDDDGIGPKLESPSTQGNERVVIPSP